jgi:hypothetical protein
VIAISAELQQSVQEYMQKWPSARPSNISRQFNIDIPVAFELFEKIGKEQANAGAESPTSIPAPEIAVTTEQGLIPSVKAAINRDFHVFALTPKDKRPLPGSAGFKDSKSPSDPQVLSPWNEDPTRNIGIDLGASDLSVLDFDKPELMPEWVQQLKTYKVRTSKGIHVYFRGARKTTKLRVDGQIVGDLKSIGGYVLGENSLHPDGPVYTAIDDSPIVALPERVSELLRNDSERVTASIDGPKIPRGSHDNELTRVAGKLRQDGLEEEGIYAAIVEVCEKRCENYGTDYKEMCRKIAKSVCKYSVAPTGQIVFPEQATTQAGPIVQVEELETEMINPADTVAEGLDFLPGRVLASTRLQDIYIMDFEPYDWPMSLALPALVTAASVIVPPMPRQESLILGDDSMTNLYTALIADVGAGKSQVIEWAARAIGIYEPPIGQHYFEGKFGSAEQMLKSLHKKQSVFTSKSVLINPDEWAHLFAKAAIPEASFPTVLTTSFYRRNQIVTVGGQGGGTEYALNLAMSFIGGIVEQDFDTVFGANTLGGLYDRFLFGRGPDGFKWNYQPCPIVQNRHWTEWNLRPVRIDESVYEVLKQWVKENPRVGRIAEVCSRIAVIYASLDGRPVVTGKDIEPLKSLALYQVSLRQVFRPNPGVTTDAVYANKALDWVNKNAPQWVSVRLLKKALFRLEEKLGPQVAERALMSLARSGRIELWIANNSDNQPPSDYQGPRVRTGLIRRAR